jgi:hypothetical protein
VVNQLFSYEPYFVILDLQYLESSEMWCWRRMEKISSTYRVTDKVLNRVNENRNFLHTIKPRKFNRIGPILRRNCLLKHVIEGRRKRRIQVKGRRKNLVDGLKETRRWWKAKQEALIRILRTASFGRCYEPVVRHTTILLLLLLLLLW